MPDGMRSLDGKGEGLEEAGLSCVVMVSYFRWLQLWRREESDNEKE